MIYKLNLSNKETIRITEDELAKFKQNIGANFLEFADGIVNPSFVISITKDIEASRKEERLLENARLMLGLKAPSLQGTHEGKELMEKNRPRFLDEDISR